MKKIILILVVMLICFIGIGEAKILRPIVGTWMSLSGISLSPGDSVPLFELPSDYPYARMCLSIPSDPGYVRIIDANTNVVVTSGGSNCAADFSPVSHRSLILQNRPDNNTTTVNFGADAYFMIELLEP